MKFNVGYIELQVPSLLRETNVLIINFYQHFPKLTFINIFPEKIIEI